MKAPLSKPTVKLIGQDGNAFAIMENIKRAFERYQNIQKSRCFFESPKSDKPEKLQVI